MDSVLKNTTLVVVGDWNAAILTPEWLLRYAFGREQGEKYPVQMEFAARPGVAPRFTIDDISVTPFVDRLMIHPNTNAVNGLNLSEQVARKILQELSHTPVRAFGINFMFKETNPDESLLGLFNVDERISGNPDYNSLGMEVIHHIDIGDGCILNFKLIYMSDSGEVSVDFNYDFRVNTASEANEKLENSFSNKYEHAIGYLNSLGLELNQNNGDDNVEAAINV